MIFPGAHSLFVVVRFADTVISPSSPRHPEQIDNNEDELLADCVPKAQNMDQSLHQSIDVITLITNMSEGQHDFLFLHPQSPGP